MALNGHPEISAETCRRVREAAERLGYRPDPVLAALAAYREQRRRPAYRSTLALVAADPVVEPPTVVDGRMRHARNPYGFQQFGLLKRVAGSLGYDVEFVAVGGKPAAQRRWGERLWRRGIRGLLVRSSSVAAEELDLPWERFATVKLSGGPEETCFHQVNTDNIENMFRAKQALAQRGYRRPVWLLSPHGASSEMGRRLLAAFLHGESVSDWAPQVLVETRLPAWVEWCRDHRPDVVLNGSNGAVWPELRQRLGKDAAELGYADLHLLQTDLGVAGIFINHEQMLIHAVRLLDGLLRHNQLGLPEWPAALRVPGRWIEGDTLPIKAR